MTFWPQHELGLDGMPRRIYHYPQAPEWAPLNLLATIGAFLIALSVLVMIVNVLRSWRGGARAPANPWDGDTLEWATTSPPPPHNFDYVPPVHSARPLKEAVPAAGHA
jgi:heme/copper-type cytochrome/quinol oxidase subunit 1